MLSALGVLTGVQVLSLSDNHLGPAGVGMLHTLEVRFELKNRGFRVLDMWG